MSGGGTVLWRAGVAWRGVQRESGTFGHPWRGALGLGDWDWDWEGVNHSPFPSPLPPSPPLARLPLCALHHFPPLLLARPLHRPSLHLATTPHHAFQHPSPATAPLAANRTACCVLRLSSTTSRTSLHLHLLCVFAPPIAYTLNTCMHTRTLPSAILSRLPPFPCRHNPFNPPYRITTLQRGSLPPRAHALLHATTTTLSSVVLECVSLEFAPLFTFTPDTHLPPCTIMVTCMHHTTLSVWLLVGTPSSTAPLGAIALRCFAARRVCRAGPPTTHTHTHTRTSTPSRVLALHTVSQTTAPHSCAAAVCCCVTLNSHYIHHMHTRAVSSVCLWRMHTPPLLTPPCTRRPRRSVGV